MDNEHTTFRNILNKLDQTPITDFTKLGAVIFSSRDNWDFQKEMAELLTRKIRQMISSDRSNIFSALFKMNEINKPKVLQSNLISVTCYSSHVSYSLVLDVVDRDAEVGHVNCSFGAAYDTERLVSLRVDILVDTLNNREFLAVADAGIARRVPTPENDTNIVDESGLLPVGMVAGLWPVLPNEIEILDTYGTIPTGTTLKLDPDMEIYKSAHGGLSASLYHRLLQTSLPIFPPAATFFSADEDNPDFNIVDHETDSKNRPEPAAEDEEDPGLNDFLGQF